MARSQTIRVNDLSGLLNRLFPFQLAEDWDNVGLQLGEGEAPVEKVLVCLDIDTTVIAEAERLGAQAIVAHHPLLFKPLKRIAPVDEVGRSVYDAIRAGIALFSLHTNLDRARGGLNDWLAERLGLEQLEVLADGGDDSLLKLVVYVPEGHQDKVSDALFASGAGHIGKYDSCSFRVEGEGSFRPGAGTNPWTGREGELERVREWRLETVVPRERLDRAVAWMVKAHPYEEVAYDILPMQNRRTDIGLGRIGRLPQPQPLEAFAARVKSALDLDHLRLSGTLVGEIGKVAVCGGSGAFLLHQAHRRGADVLITGDVKYHEAREAEQLGIVLLDAGHFGTEKIAIEGLVKALTLAARQNSWTIEFIAHAGEAEPFRVA
ncbi:MAG: Nif3-like dinuclear metal center hexameric protein [Deltaproteobacteria bacterium]|nr:MAG: Nif3-like dinuclear metal center hexameric protein [Deltaproteobacteria bacterium]